MGGASDKDGGDGDHGTGFKHGDTEERRNAGQPRRRVTVSGRCRPGHGRAERSIDPPRTQAAPAITSSLRPRGVDSSPAARAAASADPVTTRADF